MELAALPPGTFQVQGTNGYSIVVVGAQAADGRLASVTLYAYGPLGGVVYSGRAHVSDMSMSASFGVLGSINVAFHPSGGVARRPSKCGGRPVRYLRGFYEGTISFTGEDSYTAVSASRAAGNPSFLLRLLCPGSAGISESGGDAQSPGAQLLVSATAGSGGAAHLRVIKNGPVSRAHFEAGDMETREGVKIRRFTGAVTAPWRFRYRKDLSRALVMPPQPFSGRAVFDARARPKRRWSGDLSVNFPGQPHVKLTGGARRVTLLHAYWRF